jgi:hypothetical protein
MSRLVSIRLAAPVVASIKDPEYPERSRMDEAIFRYAHPAALELGQSGSIALVVPLAGRWLTLTAEGDDNYLVDFEAGDPSPTEQLRTGWHAKMEARDSAYLAWLNNEDSDKAADLFRDWHHAATAARLALESYERAIHLDGITSGKSFPITDSPNPYAVILTGE